MASKLTHTTAQLLKGSDTALPQIIQHPRLSPYPRLTLMKHDGKITYAMGKSVKVDVTNGLLRLEVIL